MDQLCSRCSSIFSSVTSLRALHSSRGFEHYGAQELQDSTQRGCQFCAMLWQTCKSRRLFEAFTCLRLNVIYGEMTSKGSQGNADFQVYPNDMLNAESILIGICESLWEPGVVDHYNPNFVAYKPSHQKSSVNLSCPPLNYDMGGDEVIHRAKELLKLCTGQHKVCSRKVTQELPSRVLDVGSEDGKLPLRLHVKHGSEHADYVTLSYCWGGPQQFTTTRNTLKERAQGIDFMQLPQTIQDAVKFTRKLGFRYLWIDALCILQDSTDDKRVEINKMGKIYKNSTITISASNAENVHKGFLRSRHLDQGCVLPLCLPNNFMGEIGVVKSSSLWWDDCPLSKRSWTLQEDLLSPRVLQFGQGEVGWQCQFESFPVVPSVISYFPPRLRRLPSDIFNATSSSGKNKEDQALIWESMILDYSMRDCTWEADRMPAIAGIASELGQVWSDVYLAGMWKACLLKHLAWHCRDRKGAVPLNVQDIGVTRVQPPSWSWLSAVPFDAIYFEEFKPKAVLKDCTVRLANEYDKYGWVLRGTLVLEGALSHNSAFCDSQLDIKMDSNSDGVPPHPPDCWYFWLGYRRGMGAIGLILLDLGQRTFKRVGQLRHDATPFKFWEEFENETVTII